MDENDIRRLLTDSEHLNSNLGQLRAIASMLENMGYTELCNSVLNVWNDETIRYRGMTHQIDDLLGID